MRQQVNSQVDLFICQLSRGFWTALRVCESGVMILDNQKKETKNRSDDWNNSNSSLISNRKR